jgi:hypothetical protein
VPRWSVVTLVGFCLCLDKGAVRRCRLRQRHYLRLTLDTECDDGSISSRHELIFLSTSSWRTATRMPDRSASRVRQRARSGVSCAEGAGKAIRPRIADTCRFRRVEQATFDVVVAEQRPGYSKADITCGVTYVGSFVTSLFLR